MHEYICYSKIYCWSALGYYERAASLQGGWEPQVSELECVCEGGQACHFEIRWADPEAFTTMGDQAGA